MLVWIVIYSFFESSDFVDEVIVLCTNTTFWLTVLASVVIALGKHITIIMLTDAN